MTTLNDGVDTSHASKAASHDPHDPHEDGSHDLVAEQMSPYKTINCVIK